MLVLSRKSGESIRIGDDVVVRVERIRGKKVSLVIDAPREIPIARAELLPGDQAVRETTTRDALRLPCV